MRVAIRNRSNKPKSKKNIEELRAFIRQMVKELGIRYIRDVNITFNKDWGGYYPKGKPLHGFKKLYSHNIIRIDLIKHWDKSKRANRDAIVHELTHVKQMQEKRMIINKSETRIKWNGKWFDGWKKFRFSDFEKLTTADEEVKYLNKHLPWEKEVQRNTRKYVWNIRG